MHARDKMAKWLEDTGMSQEDAAEAIGLYGQSNVSQYIQGKIKQPGWEWMLGVARAMNCSLEWLVDEGADFPMVSRSNQDPPLSEDDWALLVLAHQVDDLVGPKEAVRRLLGISSSSRPRSHK